MAPKTNSDEKLKNPKYRLVHFKPNRTQPPCNGSVSKNQSEKRDVASRSATEVKPPENYENLLLFYLTKLKNLFSNNHPEPAARENSAIRMNKLHHNHYLRSMHRASSIAHPCRYTSSNPPKPREDVVRSNVYKVVSAALEYGFANNVLEKKGDYFCLKNRRSRIAARQPTPGPRYCERCCNAHHVKRKSEDSFSNRFSERNKPLSPYCERPLHTIEQGKIDRHYRHRCNSMCFHRHHRSYDRPLRKPMNPHHCCMKMKDSHCQECRVLQRERKQL